MYQGYLGGNNDNPMIYPNQNFPQLNQTNPQNNFNSGMMGYGSMMKTTSGGIQKTNDPMMHGSHLMGGLKNPTLSQNTSDGSNSQALAAKKLSFNSGVFIPKSTSQTSEMPYNNPGGSYGQPTMQGSMMSQGVPMMQQVNPYQYQQPSGVMNPIPNMGMSKFPQNVITSSSPMPQITSPQMGFGLSTPNYMAASPNPMAGGMGPGSNYEQQMYIKSNTSFLTGNNSSFPSSGLSSIDTSFSSNIEYNGPDMEKEFEKFVENIANLKFPEKREDALYELSKKRENSQSLARLLWYSVGTVAILLQEIIAIYPSLSPPNLSQSVSNKVCNVLGLLQCLALHPDTRSHFLNAHIPLFLYPFLNTSSKSKPFENLRVTSLGVIGALVKGDDSDAINFLVQTEIIPLCLRIMKRGLELSRTVATFIVQKILFDQHGLTYVCQAVDRFYAVLAVLNQMIEEMTTYNKEDQRLLRHIIRCYLRLSDNQKANDALRKGLPAALMNPDQSLITDENVKKWHIQLLQNIGFYNPTLHSGFN